MNVDRNPVSDRNSSQSARKPNSFYTQTVTPSKNFTPRTHHTRFMICVSRFTVNKKAHSHTYALLHSKLRTAEIRAAAIRAAHDARAADYCAAVLQPQLQAWRSYFHCRAKWRIVLFFFIHVLMVPPSLPTTSVAHGNCSLHTHVAETEAHVQGVHAQQESLAWLPLERHPRVLRMFCSGSFWFTHAENRLFIIVLTNHVKTHSQRTHYHHS